MSINESNDLQWTGKCDGSGGGDGDDNDDTHSGLYVSLIGP